MGDTFYMNNDVEIESKLTECPLCKKTMDTPKDIPCLHTFCKGCIAEYIMRKPLLWIENKNKTCPKCDSSIGFDHPFTHQLAAKWSDNLPNNFLIPGLIKRALLERNKMPCTMCIRLDRDSKATFVCEDCLETVCDKCKPYHEVATRDSKHKTVSIHKLGRLESEHVLNNIFQTQCNQHADEKIKFFCNDHKVPCCQTCVTVNYHRRCDSVDAIQDAAKTYLSGDNILRNQENLDDLIELAKEIANNAKKNKEKIIKECKSATQKVDDLLKGLVKKIKNFGQTKKGEISRHQEEAIDDLERTEEEAKQLIENLTHKREILTVSLRKASGVQTMIQSLQISNTYIADSKSVAKSKNDRIEYKCKCEINLDIKEVMGTISKNIIIEFCKGRLFGIEPSRRYEQSKSFNVF